MLPDRRTPTTSRRRFLTVAAAGASALAAGALAGAAAPRANAAPLVRQTATLRVAFYGATVRDGVKNSAEAFKQKNPNVNVEITPIQATDWEQFFSKILTNIAAGTAPDIVTVATEGTHLFASQGLAEPLDEYVKRDSAALKEYFSDVSPALIEAMMYEGSLYELPDNFNAANMFINLDRLREAGASMPAADWTRDDFYTLAKQLTKKSGNQTDVFGYSWVNRLWGSWMPWIFVNGSNLLVEERAPGGEWLWNTFYNGDPAAGGRGGGWRWTAPQANNAANLEALEFVLGLTKEGIAPPAETVTTGGQTILGFFASGKVAMTPAGGFWAGGLANAGMTADGYDVQFFPRWKGQRHQLGTGGYVMMKQTRDKDLAWEYMKHIISRESMVELYRGNPTTPVRRSMLNDDRYGPTGPRGWRVFYDTLDKYTDTGPIPAPPIANPMTTAFTKYTGLVMAEEMTPREGLDALQKDLEGLFAGRR